MANMAPLIHIITKVFNFCEVDYIHFSNNNSLQESNVAS